MLNVKEGTYEPLMKEKAEKIQNGGSSRLF
jgi:hypothetical protein